MYKFIYLFLAVLDLFAARRLSLVVASGGYSLLQCAGFCSGFCCCGAWALGARASVVVVCRLSRFGSQALELRLRSCGART